jgi:hypothetical protein
MNMISEWKIRQEIYHRLNTDHSDDLNDKDVVLTDNVVDDAVRYFYERDIGWIYPSKSYMVGICYAKWLSEEFGGDPLEYLNDPELLYGNDPYFVIYDNDKKTYDKILDKIQGWNFNSTLGMCPDVKGYFIDEFQLESL